ncbi:UbiA prenyltransferase family [Flagelloscypha sp. PMI_526]|nr:UbiA prenyltransferase family [Flagelloscypha sp. PMI_526]
MGPLQYPLGFLQRHCYTALLLTWTDYKTIFVPITILGCVSAPVHSPTHFWTTTIWIWIHLLLCNVSNQARGYLEDKINKPWRPLPAGRLTLSQVVALRWITTFICLVLSSLSGVDMIMVTFALILTVFAYNEGELSGHPLGKNVCNLFGYCTFSIGSAKLMGETRVLNNFAISVIVLNCAIIFTTIHTQDFADVEGDLAIGRRTFPIYAPEFSRFFTLCTISCWSIFLSWYWDISWGPTAIFVILGLITGGRFYWLRTEKHDKRSFQIFNLWLLLTYLLPLQVRFDGRT